MNRSNNYHIRRGNYLMKVTVIGATGATGRKVIERALDLGHEVVAVARRPEVIAPTARLSVRQGDVLDMPSIAKALADTDVVISCIGPTGNFSQGTVISEGISNIRKNFSPGTIMSVGITNILAACQSAGVKRFVMQSGIGLSDGKELSALNRLAINISGRVFTKAVEDKAIAERAVQRSELDWIIVRPPALSDVAATSKYTAGPSTRISPLRPLSFADCADCLVRAATNEPTWVRKVVNVGR
ncbi:NAD(P)-dependent oxidoreductase [Paenibacillus illinoisensis]|nr:NAD(P)H-binding protein [Paenibacillus illinoisensis]